MNPLEWLLSLLRDEAENLSPQAYQERYERTHPAELRPLLHHEDSVVWYLALEMLGNRATFDDLEPLLTDEEYDVQRTAETLLLEFANPQQLRSLMIHYDGYDDKKIISVLAERATLDELRALLQDENGQVSEFALKAMGEQSTRDDVEPLLGDKSEWSSAFDRFVQLISPKELRPFLSADDYHLRRSAIQAYLPFASNQEVVDLLQENESDTFKDIAKVAARRGMTNQLEAIWRDVEHNPIWRRYPAFEIYAEYVSPAELKSALIAADPELFPRCLYQARHLTEIDELIPFLQSGSEEECREILRIFGHKIDESYIRPLLQDEEILIRLAALRALGERATKADAEILFLDETYEADERAFDVYSLFSTPQEWRKLFHHTDANVRYAAVHILQQEEGNHPWYSELRKDLLPLLLDEDEDVRDATLCVLCSDAPAELLRTLLDDEDEMVREAAMIFLDDRATAGDIEKALQDNRGYEGRRAIGIAAYHPDMAVKKVLIQHILNPSAPNRDWGVSSLIWALRRDFVKPPDD